MELNQEKIHARIMLMGTKILVKKIIWVIFPRNVYQFDHAFRYSFPHPIIDDIIVLIIEGAIGNVPAGYRDLIVSQYLLCTIYRNPKYYGNIGNFHFRLSRNPHGHQF